MISPIRIAPWLLALLAAPAAADVLTVGPTGAFATIQSAVSAAVDGDTIRVGPGVTVDPGGIDIAGRRLSLVAGQSEAIMVAGTFLVRNLSPADEVVLAGLQLELQGSSAGLALVDNQGSVRFQDCRLSATSRIGVNASRCDDISFAGCQISAAGQGMPTGTGVIAFDSRVTFDGCVVEGPSGPDGVAIGVAGKPGGTALRFLVSEVYASGSTFLGGDGGEGGPCLLTKSGKGGAGGHAVWIESGTFRHRACTLTGGAGGAPGSTGPAGCTPGAPGTSGASISGTYAAASAGPHRALAAPMPVRELQTFPVTLVGAPGDLAAVLWGPAGAWVSAAGVTWPVLVSPGPQSQVRLVGVVPAGGSITVQLAFPDLGPGVESARLLTQPLFQSPGGVITAGGPLSFVVLDGAF